MEEIELAPQPFDHVVVRSADPLPGQQRVALPDEPIQLIEKRRGSLASLLELVLAPDGPEVNAWERNSPKWTELKPTRKPKVRMAPTRTIPLPTSFC
ncbi:MAG: hypothetical protein ACUVRH_04935 [Candidatus Bipolaricaulia bacterium]